jgi:hypothetical protein
MPTKSMCTSKLRSFGMWLHLAFYLDTNVSEESAASHPEDVGSKFLRNIGTYLPNYVASDLEYCYLNIQLRGSLKLQCTACHL